MARSVQRVPSGVRGQSSWGGQGKPHEAVGFLAQGWNWLSEGVTRCATMTSIFAGTTLPGGGAVPPILSHQFCANLVSGLSGGFKPPKPPRGLATAPKMAEIDRSRMTSYQSILWMKSLCGPIPLSIKFSCCLCVFLEKHHCQCKHSSKTAQLIFTNFNYVLKFTIFKTESHEFSNYDLENGKSQRSMSIRA